MKPALPCALVALVLSGCSHRARGLALTAADLQEPERTRITNYMDAPRRFGAPYEQPPAPMVSRASLADEARVVRTTGELCFALVIRSAVDLDTPLSEMRMLINGKPGRVGVDEEVFVHDYPFSGERDVLVAEHVGRDAFSSLHLTAPVDKVFRVIERRGQVCRSLGDKPPRKFSLEVIIVQDDNRGNWGERFDWSLD